MSISPGTRFGPYKVAGEIGAGGMGVVYRATDTTLEREVAIKVLPESMASDAERIARFDREAKTLASLNHPNIAQIYGLEKADGTTALVMELVEGPTLADRIEEGALPADEALSIAMQIAEALEGAHGQGIVHRDLKPANIKLRPDGTVKVLDFGIAKALAPDLLTSAPQSPMLTTPATMAGVILGTAAYMSPEQAKGKQIDQRTDIWAFGCLLYEMLTGQMAFGAEDVPTTLARVIDRETDIDSLPASISPAVRQAIKLCLQKDVKKRVRDIGDVRLALEGAFETVSPEAATVAQPLWRRALPLAAAVLVTGVLVGLAGEMLRPAPEPSSVNLTPEQDLPEAGLRRWTMNLDEAPPIGATGVTVELAVSSDGSRITYKTGAPDTGPLYVRELDRFQSVLVPGTEGARWPAFSHDNEWIAYGGMGAMGSNPGLNKISVRGGPPQPLAATGAFLRASWGVDDVIVYAPREVPGMGMGGGMGMAGPLMRVPAAGGAPEVLIDPEPGSVYIFPDVLSEANAVLFTVIAEGAPARDGSIAVLDLETNEYRTLITGGYNARYAPTGHIVFARGGALWAVPFDLDDLQITGTEAPMIDGVQMNGVTGDVPYGLSDNGLLVYVLGGDVSEGAGPNSNASLVWVDRNGRVEPLGAEQQAYSAARLSPDGQRVAVSIDNASTQDIWVYDLSRDTLSRVTFGPGSSSFPLWMPDGERILYSSTRDGEGGIYRKAANGTGQEERLMTGTGDQLLNSISGDGRYLFFINNASGSFDMFAMSLEGEREIVPTVQTTFNEGFDSLSPDGRWLAYGSNETGRWELYVRPFPDVDTEKWQISTSGADFAQALWAPDGSELYYVSGEAEFLAVAIETEPTFSWSSAEVLFPWGGGLPPFGVSPDGERFLAIRTAVETQDEFGSTYIAFVDNWFDDLRRLAPTE